MKKARIIYNPTSGKELVKKSLPDILDVLEQAGFETSAFATTPEPDSAKKEAKRAAEAAFALDHSFTEAHKLAAYAAKKLAGA